jgi:hypothetical protein
MSSLDHRKRFDSRRERSSGEENESENTGMYLTYMRIFRERLTKHHERAAANRAFSNSLHRRQPHPPPIRSQHRELKSGKLDRFPTMWHTRERVHEKPADRVGFIG